MKGNSAKGSNLPLLSLIFLLHFVVFKLTATSGEPNVQYIRKEVEWGKPINLESFGCPHIEFSVRNREMSYVSVGTADFTRMVPIARTNIRSVEVDNLNGVATVYGNTSMNMQPTQNTRNIEKKKGTTFPGSNSTMYLLYREPSTGVGVYFLDALSRQNHDSIVIAIPKPESPATPQISLLPLLPPPSTSMPTTLAPNKSMEGQPISPELFARYIALQKEREALDISNPEAVTEFNIHAATYHEALKKARAAQQK